MTGIIGEFRIGEDIALALEPAAGDPLTVTGITARMKPALVSGNRLALDDTAAGTAMQVASQGAEGWVLSLDHGATAALAAGLYGIDARLVFADAVEITEQSAFIALSRAALT
jgi:hypothetical protein